MENRLDTIRAATAPVFGVTLDRLARDVDARVRPAERAEFDRLIETWRLEENGEPAEPQALQDALLALAARAERLPGGSPARAIFGALVGGLGGVGVGFVAYMVLRQVVIPYSLQSSDTLQWLIVLGVAAGFATIGFRHGGRPSRAGRAMWAFMRGFLAGALLCGVAGGALAIVLGKAFGVSNFEGAFAMGIFFVIIPASAALGGLAVGAWRGWRAWKR